MTWLWTPNAPTIFKAQETILRHEYRGYLSAPWKTARLFSVLCEKISKGMLLVSWELFQLHETCVVQGFNVMQLEQVLDERILFQLKFQIFTPSEKLHICRRNLISAHSSLWTVQKNPSDHLCWAVSAQLALSLEGRFSASLQTLALTTVVSGDGCRFLRCSLSSWNCYSLLVDSRFHTKPAFSFTVIPINLGWCILLWVGAAPAEGPVVSCRLRSKGCDQLFIKNFQQWPWADT